MFFIFVQDKYSTFSTSFSKVDQPAFLEISIEHCASLHLEKKVSLHQHQTY